MRRPTPRAWLAAALLLALVAVAPTAGAEDGPRVLVVRGDLSLAILADPAARLDAVALVVRNGKIAGTLARGQEAPEGAEILDAGDAFILPGLVHACALATDARTDAPDPITPDHRAIDGFDPYDRADDLVSRGVTTVWLSPSRKRLLTGVGAVVKTAGDARVLVDRSALRLTLGPEGLNPPAVHRPPIEPDPFEKPLEPALPPPPSTRAEAVRMLREAFSSATAGPLAEARAGRLAVRIHVGTEDEVRLALDLVRELRLRAVLELADPEAARKALAALREAVLPVVLERGGPDGAAVLRETGPGAIAPPGRAGLLAAAASAARDARDRDVLRAVTIDAARVLGVDRRVGSLDVGKDADLVLVDGSPLSPEASIRAVLVDGRVVHERKPTPGLLAIRAARVLDGDGGVHEDVVLVCRDGKILEMGRDVRLPPDAERVVWTGTVVPGFVDAWSHEGVPGGDLKTTAAAAARPDAEALTRWRRRGVTSLALVPRGVGLFAGGVSVIETELAGGKPGVVRDRAAWLVNVGTGGDRAARALEIRDLVDSVKAYAEAWRAHEEAKAKGEKTKAPRRDPRLEPFRDMGEGAPALLVRADRPEDLRAAIALREAVPTDAPLVLLGGAGAFRVAADLAASGVPVVVAGLPSANVPGRGRVSLVPELSRAGVPVALGSAGNAGFAPLDLVGAAIREGLSPRAALAAVTVVPARAFGVADRVGRIAPGLEADLVHLAADPGEPGCHVLHVVANGRIVHEREDER